MGDWSPLRILESDTVGQGAASDYGTVVTASATAHVKGAWTSLVDPVPFDVHGFRLSLGNSSAGGNTGAVLADLAIGPTGGGGEQILLGNMSFRPKRAREQVCSFFVPLYIPEGVRLSGRMQSINTSSTITMAATLYQYTSLGLPIFHHAVTYGADEADSGGVTLDAGGTANTKGGYVEIVAATTDDIRYALLFVGANLQFAADVNFRLDLAIGAGAAEKEILKDLILKGGIIGDTLSPPIVEVLRYVPEGTRLAAQIQSTSITATERTVDVVVIGLH